MDEQLSFEEFFRAQIKDRGLTIKRISELSGISVKHLEALARGNFSVLPSAPYFRGYLMKLGAILDFDSTIWWTKFKEGGFVKDAGGEDAPPRNRFIRPSAGSGLRPALVKWIWAGAAIVALLVYLGLQSARIMGKPAITVSFPAENPAHMTENMITMKGALENGSGLYVNGELVTVGVDGGWEKPVLLQAGINTLEITAKKFLGGETKIVEQIIYEPQPAATPTTK